MKMMSPLMKRFLLSAFPLEGVVIEGGENDEEIPFLSIFSPLVSLCPLTYILQ